jgi:SWI/SNF-related matrix-associated actin-dependent regulator 1 of chromatin subfamily A
MPFQKEGVEFVVGKDGRACIADEMGLGKTLQAIAVASFYRQDWPCLVVMPASMRWTWALELEKWLDELRPGDVKVVRNMEDTDDIDAAKFVLCTYDLLARSAVLQKGLHAVNFGVCIVDESHYCKNKDTKRTAAVQSLGVKIKRCVLLSGTPALNRPVELYPQIAMLKPALLGSFTAFTKRHCDAHRGKFGWEYRGATNLEELSDKLRQVMVRRLKNDVLDDLPSKRRQYVPLELDPRALKDLQANLKALEGASEKFEIAVLWSKLAMQTAEAKKGAAAEYVKDLVEGGTKLLVFAHFLSVLDHLEQALTQSKVSFIRIDGSVSASDRQAAVTRFQSDDTVRVAILSLRAAGQGLTLTAAATVVFAELDVTPGLLLQAEDRVHRIGQTSAVNIHYLVGRGTLDERVWRMIERKLSVLGNTLNGKKEQFGAQVCDVVLGAYVEGEGHDGTANPAPQTVASALMPALPRACGTVSIRSFFGSNTGGSAHKTPRDTASSSADSQGGIIHFSPSQSIPMTQVSSAETVVVAGVGGAGSAGSKAKGGSNALERVRLQDEELASLRGGERGVKGGRGWSGGGGKARERCGVGGGGGGSAGGGSAVGQKGRVYYIGDSDDSQDQEDPEAVGDVNVCLHREAAGGCQISGGHSCEVLVIEDSQDAAVCQGQVSGEECGTCTLRNAQTATNACTAPSCGACGARRSGAAPAGGEGAAADSAAPEPVFRPGAAGRGSGGAGCAAEGGQGVGGGGVGRGRQWLRRWGFRVSTNTERVYVYARKVTEGGEGEGKGAAGGEERDLQTASFLGSVLYLDLLDGGAPEWLGQQRDRATEATGASRGEASTGDGVIVKHIDPAEERMEVEESVRMFVKEWGQLRAVERAKLSDASARRLLRLPLTSSLSALSRSSAAAAAGEQVCTERYVSKLPFAEQAHLCGWCGAPGRDDSRFCSAKCSEAFGVCASSKAIRAQLYELEKGVCQLCRLDAVGATPSPPPLIAPVLTRGHTAARALQAHQGAAKRCATSAGYDAGRRIYRRPHRCHPQGTP